MPRRIPNLLARFLCLGSAAGMLLLLSGSTALAQANPASQASPQTAPKPAGDAAKPAGEAAAGGEVKANDPGVPAGHSAHGEAFNEGPRQKAYLMGGTGKCSFPITAKAPEAQQFFNQGLGQLHGFWYLEAERSFRQAAALDPDCVMAYWGMALANLGNEKRAKGLLKRAVDRKGQVSPREQKYIDGLDKALNAGGNEKDRRRAWVRSFENLSEEFPDDLEAKALLGWLIWVNDSKGLPISSHLAVDALLKDVLRAEPAHPVHHYRIHLWDNEKAARALDSAAQCGQAAPGIGHMWHMSGHIYSKVGRYVDAIWQQDASGRVDHAYMVRDHVMPYEIHNYAHNQEWCVRNMMQVGRVGDALAMAKNLVEMPWHPQRNTIAKGGTAANYGRARLIQVLQRYELWDETLALAETPYLAPTADETEQIKRLRLLGVAAFERDRTEAGNQALADLEARLGKVQTEQKEAGDKAEAKAKEEKMPDDKVAKARKDAENGFTGRLNALEGPIAELQAAQALRAGDAKRAFELLAKAKNVHKERLSQLHARAGDLAQAEKTAKEAYDADRAHTHALANYVDILARAGKDKEAQEHLALLRKQSSQLDLAAPAFARLAPLATAAGWPADWRMPAETAGDVGVRPDLASLGPHLWHPWKASEFSIADSTGKSRRLEEYRGKPLVVIFYLGAGCLHCMEQLQKFSAVADKYAAAGISLLAISTDAPDVLQKSLDKPPFAGSFPIPLASNEGLELFKLYRAYDDFEKVPLHGTFLIDADGFVRWQDIGYDPFSDAGFLLEESQRLLHPALRAAER